ncbi:MAG TPA: NADH-quinone oxidoreductase subunit NuoE [Burkholderiales bacterium]|nr:NADH-quinone oxidoreductase subunit NuoE [Burkholderiales bacterium]
MTLSPESLKKIDREVAKYPPGQKQSAVMAALRFAQDEKGWLSPETMDFVANYLEMEPIAVYEVATFYNMYDLKPVGKYKITLCTNLPCALSGANDVAKYLKEKLGIGFDETTPDGRITLRQGECFGSCGYAPVVILNNRKMCGSLSFAEVDRILSELE